MLSRRRFSACAVCVAAGGLFTTAARAQSQAAPAAAAKRTVLRKIDFPGDKYATIQVMVDIPAGATVPRHTHPGVESAYVLEGEGDLFVQGQADRTLTAADGFQIPPEVPHGVRNVRKTMKVAVTYVVEKDKPLASPAPE